MVNVNNQIKIQIEIYGLTKTHFAIKFIYFLTQGEIMNKIAFYRKKLSLTQCQLGEKLGWAQSRVANYELGTRFPSIEIAKKIVIIFNDLGINCTIDDVFPIKINGTKHDE